MVLASTRTDIADFLSTVIYVYTLLIILYIVTNLLFAAGLRPPYSRTSNAILTFLRDVSEPFLRLFRRVLPAFGGFDFSPILAILTLASSTAWSSGASSTARGARWPRAWIARRAPSAPALRAWLLDRARGGRGLGRRPGRPSARSNTRSCRGEEQRFLPGVQLVNTRNQGVAFGFLPGKHLWRDDPDRASRWWCCSCTSPATPRAR